MTQNIERISVSIIVSLMSGFILTIVLSRSIELAFFIWIIATICAGAAIGNTQSFSIKAFIKCAILPSIVLSGTPVFFFYYQVVFSLIEKPQLYKGTLIAACVNPFDPLVIVLSLLLFIICSLMSLFFISASILASRVIFNGVQKLYEFGPQGIKRIRIIILGIGSVILALLSIISIISK
jgi:hypothetical protein